MKVDTVKIKADTAKGYKVINRSDYDPKQHQAFDEGQEARKARNLADAEATEKLAAERRAQGNFGQVDGNALDGSGKNPSGTFSEPTPSDIRYPDKNATEFENNHGAFVARSAADLRAEQGLPDEPGGVKPEQHARVQAVEEATAAIASGKDVEITVTKASASADANDDGNLTRPEIMAELDRRGVSYDPREKKADLQAKLDAAD